MQSIAYQLGRFWSRLNVATRIVAVVGGILLMGWWARPAPTQPGAVPASAAAMDRQAATAASAVHERIQEACKAQLPELRASFQKAIAQGKYNEAVAASEACAQVAGDPEMAAAVKAAKLKATLATVKSANAQAGDRVRALHILQREFPDQAHPFAGLEEPLSRQAERDTKAAEARRKRSEGVTIGMSQEDVRASSWGKPQHINRTTHLQGTHEQWVYHGGYLYFDDGVLTSIQN